MIKIALDLQDDMKDYIIENLKKRGFDVTDNSSFGTVWVYGLSHIDYSANGIEICKFGSMQFYDILLEDVKYFEIHPEEE